MLLFSLPDGALKFLRFACKSAGKNEKKYVLRGGKKAERRERVTVLYRW